MEDKSAIPRIRRGLRILASNGANLLRKVRLPEAGEDETESAPQVSNEEGGDWTSVVDTKDIHAIVRKHNDSEAYDEYRRLWKESYDLGDVPDYPIQLDFELNYSCNFRCPMCTWSAESTKGMGKETWFDFEVFKEVITDGVSKGLKVVRLNYINEPLIRKDVIKYINFARQAGVLDVYFSTNGSLLDEKISRELINSGLTRIQISLDAATDETFKKIRVSNYSLEQILSKVERFIDIRDNEVQVDLPTLRVNFVKTEENKEELQQFINFWRDKADAIGIQDLVNIIKPTVENRSENIRSFKCSQPFNHLVIRYNGAILPCCTFFGAELPIARLKSKKKPDIQYSKKRNVGMDKSPLIQAKELAQLLTQSIEEAWMSDQIQFLREIHRKGEYWKHPVCKKCVESSSHHDETQG